MTGMTDAQVDAAWFQEEEDRYKHVDLQLVDQLALVLHTNWWHAARLVVEMGSTSLVEQAVAGDRDAQAAILQRYSARYRGLLDKNSLRKLKRDTIARSRRRLLPT